MESTRAATFSIRGKVLLGRRLVSGSVIVADGRIAGIHRGERGELPSPVYDAVIVSPGFIDLQVNGGFGVEVSTEAEIRRVAANLPASGVTSFLPTLVTAPDDFYEACFQSFGPARDARGARPLGWHIEGPFLSPERKGAHRREIIEGASDALFARMLECADVRLMTLAPERPGALERIRRLRERGVLVSLGHTNASAEEFERGADAGARMATHLYNAMSPFGHRSPNAVGAALTDDRITAGLIPDGIHSDPRSIDLAVRAKGVDRCVLVTDMMSAAGMPPGEYSLSGSRVIVDTVSARLADGTLAGAVLSLDAAVRNIVEWSVAGIAGALHMVTAVPARLLGEDRIGRIEIGARADLVLLDERLGVRATFVEGELIHEVV